MIAQIDIESDAAAVFMKQSVIAGAIYLMAAQVAFVAPGYAIHIELGRLLGYNGYMLCAYR